MLRSRKMMVHIRIIVGFFEDHIYLLQDLRRSCRVGSSGLALAFLERGQGIETGCLLP